MRLMNDVPYDLKIMHKGNENNLKLMPLRRNLHQIDSKLRRFGNYLWFLSVAE